MVDDFASAQVLAATQTPGDAGKKWFQGTADAVRQFGWLFEVCFYLLFVKKKKKTMARLVGYHMTVMVMNFSV